jgi:formate-dependent nitrite reductase membrane component NrfD/ferredoxin
MYQRDDGIVEFDKDVCIGCKACLQACPYDAIYVDPDTGTAAKCHYCAHRTDIGLEPACVVVCPEHAIVAGDLDDPASEISNLLAKNKVTVRKPEQGTAPKLFYINGNDVTLHPSAVTNEPVTYAWADSIERGAAGAAGIADRSAGDGAPSPSPTRRTSASGAALRVGQAQGLPTAGPITMGRGRHAEQMVQVVYSTQHKMPWHWPVPAYLVTKAIGAGIAMWIALAYLLDLFSMSSSQYALTLFVSLAFTALTTALLVFDLERPERFLRILTRPQWRSWLARGAYLLIGFSVVSGVWWLLEVLGMAATGSTRTMLAIVTVPLALGAAVYTAFLFGQAEGRDLWQSSLLPVHLIVQSFMAGSGALLILAAIANLPGDAIAVTRLLFVGSIIVDLVVTLFGEFGMPHASEAAAQAAHDIRAGRYRQHFWLGSVLLGHVGPLALLLAGISAADVAASAAVIVGLYLYEYAFVMAPQHVPNS